MLHDGELHEPRQEEKEAGDDGEQDVDGGMRLGGNGKVWMVKVLVEVDGGEQEDSRGGRDEGVGEDDIPVCEVTKETLVSPLSGLQQEVVHLCRALLLSCLQSAVTWY